MLTLIPSSSNFHKSCCILQLEGVHEEITPTFVHALNENGYKVDVYLNKRSLLAKGDIYKFIPSLNADVYYISLEAKQDWDQLFQTIHNSRYSARAV